MIYLFFLHWSFNKWSKKKQIKSNQNGTCLIWKIIVMFFLWIIEWLGLKKIIMIIYFQPPNIFHKKHLNIVWRVLMLFVFVVVVSVLFVLLLLFVFSPVWYLFSIFALPKHSSKRLKLSCLYGEKVYLKVEGKNQKDCLFQWT